ncbi:nicotinamide riboside kinase 1 isoform X3 [Ambystoma mexicanum]|uniref:nicotinamide riboside kinase 1 isoform X3 n=2 Tax=Ambystoma mexicanum TaxID=8296 RepID=UPI0037E81DC0
MESSSLLTIRKILLRARQTKLSGQVQSIITLLRVTLVETAAVQLRSAPPWNPDQQKNRTGVTTMKTFVIGIGGVTNGGKTTLANRLHAQLPNSSLISQDDYFKPESEVDVDDNGFKQYDVLDALNMETMMARVHSCINNPRDLLNSAQESGKDVCFLIVEGFLLYNYKPLNDVFSRRYFLTVPYEECERRRSTRVYEPPDPPGYFDGHVWPMYLKNTKEMEMLTKDIVYINGLKSVNDIYSQVYSDIMKALEAFK